MTDRRRQLRVNSDICIGCRACAAVCPAGLIVVQDARHVRTVRFEALCTEDCVLCADACPVDAIALQPLAGDIHDGATELRFPLLACDRCGAPVATGEMLTHLRTAVPAALQVDASGQTWLGLCAPCRQRAEAEGVAREHILTRWPA